MIKKCTLKIEAMKNSRVVSYCGADLGVGQNRTFFLLTQELKEKRVILKNIEIYIFKFINYINI